MQSSASWSPGLPCSSACALPASSATGPSAPGFCSTAQMRNGADAWSPMAGRRRRGHHHRRSSLPRPRPAGHRHHQPDTIPGRRRHSRVRASGRASRLTDNASPRVLLNLQHEPCCDAAGPTRAVSRSFRRGLIRAMAISVPTRRRSLARACGCSAPNSRRATLDAIATGRAAPSGCLGRRRLSQLVRRAMKRGLGMDQSRHSRRPADQS